jgi:hypothetical protein
MMLRATTLFLAILASFGCGGSTNSVTGDPPTVTGTWNATVTANPAAGPFAAGQFTATFTLAQSDAAVSGTYTTSDGASGTVSGTVSLHTLSFTLTQSAPCEGSFTGAGTIIDAWTQMSGGYAGSDSCAGSFTVNFTATRA